MYYYTLARDVRKQTERTVNVQWATDLWENPGRYLADTRSYVKLSL
jgi:hypothetical protein